MPINPTILKHATAQVGADVVDCFHDMLTPDSALDPAFSITLGKSALAPDEIVSSSDSLVVAPWQFGCVHTGPFLGVPPTYIHLTLTGATFIDVSNPDSEHWAYHRFVDYLGALHQIGIYTSVRPALTVDQYLAWQAAQSS